MPTSNFRGEDADVLAMRSLLRGREGKWGNGGLDWGEVANEALLDMMVWKKLESPFQRLISEV